MMRLLVLASSMGMVWSCSDEATWLTDDKEIVSDPVVWVTVDSELASAFSAQTLAADGDRPIVNLSSENGVTALRLHESQMGALSEFIHDTLHRCGGFEGHDSEDEALAAVAPPFAPAVPRVVNYTIDNATEVRKLLAPLSVPKMTETVTQLSSFTNRYYTSPTGVDSQMWLKGHWESLAQGRSDVIVEAFTHPSWPQPSIILTVTGRTIPSEVIVLGAHGDSVNLNNRQGVAPGADDDASGMATLTEVIRSMMVNGFRPERTVKFISYAAEEVGLRGSKAIAAQYKAEGVDVVGVMQLDMTNYKGSATDIVIYTDFTNPGQNQFVGNLIDTYVQVSRGTARCGYACSDHASWHNQGYPTSMPFEALLRDANPSIHGSGDTLAAMGGTMDNSLKFAQLAAAFVGELAKGSTGGGGGTDTTPPTVALTAPAPGAQVASVVTVSATASDNVAVTKVEFLVDGAVAATDTTTPYSFEWNSNTVGNGAHTLAAIAYDARQNTAQAQVNVTVANQGIATAAYDASRQTLTCATRSTGCTSGTLLTGRGTVGPETNSPNTVNSSCSDGLSGTFHVDESVDQIKVTSTDGGPMSAGAAVKVDVNVWAYRTFTSDKLDLYAADDANSPTWRFIGTFAPTGAGSQTLTTTYTLGSGTVQAVRARFRYGGSVSSCGNGAYDDVDDLVFTVR